jgi:hypothetical protein
VANDEEKSFGAEIPVDLIEQFQEQMAERGILKKKAVLAMVKLWLALPQSAQYDLLGGAEPTSLMDLIRSVVKDELKKKK